MATFRVVIAGAGNIGTALAAHLAIDKDVSVSVIDPSEQALRRFSGLNLPAKTHLLDHPEQMSLLLQDADVVVAATPERAIPEIARAANEAKTHFLDFSPLHETARHVLEPLAQERVVLNGCGVSPGIMENIAHGLLDELAPVSDLTVRVGAVPRNPTNRLGYGLIWDIDGLINEYTRPCDALRDGQVLQLSPLEDLEHVVLNGVRYEAFTTSQGLKDLDMFRHAGVDNVTFKTLRYPGHLDYMRFLLDDMGLKKRRDMLRSLLSNGLPIIEDDILVVFVTASGPRGTRSAEASRSYSFIRPATLAACNTMTSVAAGYAASLLEMLQHGELGDHGFVQHHAVPSGRLLESHYLAPMMA
jgi:saccharopine dehydrogenase-like NADP-dependent oxidoreductase